MPTGVAAAAMASPGPHAAAPRRAAVTANSATSLAAAVLAAASAAVAGAAVGGGQVPSPRPVPSRCAEHGRLGFRTEKRKKVELQSRLIKNLDFIYTCVCEGRLEETYTLERQLGSGAFGTVYLARHKVLGHCRAVKKLAKAPQGQPDRLPSLIREIHALMDLDHPNIVKLVRYFDEGPDLYLVFELCEGPDLLERIHQCHDERRSEVCPGMPEPEASCALRQMLQALKCCHSHYMGHFDVKPENFMYESHDPEARLKMIDLGLSSGFKRDRQEIRGTAQYMAPEVWEGHYGPEADIWSCGAVLFEMVTGSSLVPLIESEDEIQKMVHDRTWVRSRLSWAKSLGISPPALDFLAITLQLNRHHRPSARELLWHPFLNTTINLAASSPFASSAPLPASSTANGARAGSSTQQPLWASDSKALAREAERIISGLPTSFRNFSEEPVLKKAALLIMAHIASYSFKEARPQRLAFALLDGSADGELSIEAFENHYLRAHVTIPEGLEQTFRGVDVDDDGYITYLEFLSATLPRTIRCDERLVRIVFQHLDRGHDGYIDADDLAEAFKHGLDRDKICRHALEQVSGRGRKLSWQAFWRLMCSDVGDPQSLPSSAAGARQRSAL